MKISENNSQEYLNKSFRVAKFFAIISVIAAHINIQHSYFLNKFFSLIGTFGVVVFFILSGYYFNPKKFKNLFFCISSKFKSIIIPWIFLGSLIFLYSSIIGNKNISIQKWILYLIGYKTYLYFIPILLICYILTYYAPRTLLHIYIFINFMSLIFTAMGGTKEFSQLFIFTDYMNILNWLGIFSFGLLLRHMEPQKIINRICKLKTISFVGLILSVFYICNFNLPIGYFTYYGLFIEIIGFICIIALSLNPIFHRKIIFEISRYTLPLYLLHMIVIGLIDNFYNINIFTQLISIPLVLTMTVLVIFIGAKISRLLKLDKLFSFLIGIRT